MMYRMDLSVGNSERRAIRLLVVDDHPAIVMALEAEIQAELTIRRAARWPPDREPAAIRVVGSARRVAEALDMLARTGPDQPDVVLCDIQLEHGIDGLAVIEAARAAGCRVIVLTAFDRSSLMRAAFERGASGFIDKRSEMSQVTAAIRSVAAGGTAFSATGLDAARNAPRPPSERELAVLRGLVVGQTSEEVAGHLGISTRTIESHLRRLFDRYGVVSRTELAVLAIREGWLDVDSA